MVLFQKEQVLLHLSRLDICSEPLGWLRWPSTTVSSLAQGPKPPYAIIFFTTATKGWCQFRVSRTEGLSVLLISKAGFA